MNRDEAYAEHQDGRGPVRGEVKTKQGGAPRATIWVLTLSVLLAILVGAMLLSNTDEVPPSTERLEQSAPAAPENLSPPVVAPDTTAPAVQPEAQPATPPAQTNQ